MSLLVEATILWLGCQRKTDDRVRARAPKQGNGRRHGSARGHKIIHQDHHTVGERNAGTLQPFGAKHQPLLHILHALIPRQLLLRSAAKSSSDQPHIGCSADVRKGSAKSVGLIKPIKTAGRPSSWNTDEQAVILGILHTKRSPLLLQLRKPFHGQLAKHTPVLMALDKIDQSIGNRFCTVGMIKEKLSQSKRATVSQQWRHTAALGRRLKAMRAALKSCPLPLLQAIRAKRSRLT